MKHRRTSSLLLLSTLTLTTLAACGDDTADQATDLPAAPSATQSATPFASPTTSPTAAAAVAATTTPTRTPAATPSASASAPPTASATASPTTAPTAIPGFLAGTDLPKHPTSPWFAGKVTAGLPEFAPFCLENALPKAGKVWHRSFGTEFDTHATQVTVRADSTAAAEALVDALSHAAALCAEDWLAENPEGTADDKDYGAPNAATHVYGVHTSLPESEPGVHLYGIGRDGLLVTVVQWAQMGNLSQAPVTAFKATATTAVDKLA